MPFSNVKSVHSRLLKAPGLMLVQAEGMVWDAGLTGVRGRQLASLQKLKSRGCLGQILWNDLLVGLNNTSSMAQALLRGYCNVRKQLMGHSLTPVLQATKPWNDLWKYWLIVGSSLWFSKSIPFIVINYPAEKKWNEILMWDSAEYSKVFR